MGKRAINKAYFLLRSLSFFNFWQNIVGNKSKRKLCEKLIVNKILILSLKLMYARFELNRKFSKFFIWMLYRFIKSNFYIFKYRNSCHLLKINRKQQKIPIGELLTFFPSFLLNNEILERVSFKIDLRKKRKKERFCARISIYIYVMNILHHMCLKTK